MSEHVTDHLSAYLDGALAPEERERFRLHLGECTSCAQRLEELAAVDVALRALPAGAPERYFDELPARLRGQLAASAAPRRRLPALPVWAFAAAAALVIGVLAPLTLMKSPEPAPQRAAVTDKLGRDEPAAAPPAMQLPVPQPAATAAPPREDDRLADVKKARGQANVKRDVGPDRLEKELRAEPAAPQPPAAIGGVVGGFAAPPMTAEQVQQSGPRQNQNQQVELGKQESKLKQAVESQAEPPQAAGRRARGADTKDADAVLERAPEKPAAPAAAAARSDGFAAGARVFSERFRAVQARAPRDLAEARAQREAWRRLATETADAGEADEARVLVVAAGLEAWRLERRPEDRRAAEQDAAAYLARADARQRERVRELLKLFEAPSGR